MGAQGDLHIVVCFLGAHGERGPVTQVPGCCRGSRRVVLKAAPFIEEQRGVLLKALCKPTFAVRFLDKEFDA